MGHKLTTSFVIRVFLLYAVEVDAVDKSVKPFMEFTKESKEAVTVTPYGYNVLSNDDNQDHLLAVIPFLAVDHLNGHLGEKCV